MQSQLLLELGELEVSLEQSYKDISAQLRHQLNANLDENEWIQASLLARTSLRLRISETFERVRAASNVSNNKKRVVVQDVTAPSLLDKLKQAYYTAKTFSESSFQKEQVFFETMCAIYRHISYGLSTNKYNGDVNIPNTIVNHSTSVTSGAIFLASCLLTAHSKNLSLTKLSKDHETKCLRFYDFIIHHYPPPMPLHRMSILFADISWSDWTEVYLKSAESRRLTDEAMYDFLHWEQSTWDEYWLRESCHFPFLIFNERCYAATDIRSRTVDGAFTTIFDVRLPLGRNGPYSISDAKNYYLKKQCKAYPSLCHIVHFPTAPNLKLTEDGKLIAVRDISRKQFLCIDFGFEYSVFMYTKYHLKDWMDSGKRTYTIGFMLTDLYIHASCNSSPNTSSNKKHLSLSKDQTLGRVVTFLHQVRAEWWKIFGLTMSRCGLNTTNDTNISDRVKQLVTEYEVNEVERDKQYIVKSLLNTYMSSAYHYIIPDKYTLTEKMEILRQLYLTAELKLSSFHLQGSVLSMNNMEESVYQFTGYRVSDWLNPAFSTWLFRQSFCAWLCTFQQSVDILDSKPILPFNVIEHNNTLKEGKPEMTSIPLFDREVLNMDSVLDIIMTVDEILQQDSTFVNEAVIQLIPNVLIDLCINATSQQHPDLSRISPTLLDVHARMKQTLECIAKFLDNTRNLRWKRFEEKNNPSVIVR